MRENIKDIMFFVKMIVFMIICALLCSTGNYLCFLYAGALLTTPFSSITYIDSLSTLIINDLDKKRITYNIIFIIRIIILLITIPFIHEISLYIDMVLIFFGSIVLIPLTKKHGEDLVFKEKQKFKTNVNKIECKNCGYSFADSNRKCPKCGEVVK